MTRANSPDEGSGPVTSQLGKRDHTKRPTSEIVSRKLRQNMSPSLPASLRLPRRPFTRSASTSRPGRFWCVLNVAVIIGAATTTALTAGPALPANASPMTIQQANNTVEQALHAGTMSAVIQLLNESRGDLTLQRAVLAHATDTTEVFGLTAVAARTGRIRAGCHYGDFGSKHVIAIGPAHVGTISTTIRDGFCWSGQKITWWGPQVVKTTNWPGYCWQNVQGGDYWHPAPKWRTQFATGTLGGGIGSIACFSIQSTTTWTDYANGGGIFRH